MGIGWVVQPWPFPVLAGVDTYAASSLPVAGGTHTCWAAGRPSPRQCGRRDKIPMHIMHIFSDAHHAHHFAEVSGATIVSGALALHRPIMAHRWDIRCRSIDESWL